MLSGLCWVYVLLELREDRTCEDSSIAVAAGESTWKRLMLEDLVVQCKHRAQGLEHLLETRQITVTALPGG